MRMHAAPLCHWDSACIGWLSQSSDMWMQECRLERENLSALNHLSGLLQISPVRLLSHAYKYSSVICDFITALFIVGEVWYAVLHCVIYNIRAERSRINRLVRCCWSIFFTGMFRPLTVPTFPFHQTGPFWKTCWRRKAQIVQVSRWRTGILGVGEKSTFMEVEAHKICAFECVRAGRRYL